MASRMFIGLVAAVAGFPAMHARGENFDSGTHGWGIVTMCYRPGYVAPAERLELLPCCPGECPTDQACESSISCGDKLCEPINAGGFLQHADPDGSCGVGQVQYWRAPADILSRMCHPPLDLKFDLADVGSGGTFEQEDVIIDGNGMRLVFDIPTIGASWSSYTVSLALPTGWTHDGPGGAPATSMDLALVLQSLDGFYIRAEHRLAPDVARLDNVIVTDQPPGLNPADLNADWSVDGADLGMLLGSWGRCPAGCCSGDINDSGTVDGADVGLLLGAWTS